MAVIYSSYKESNVLQLGPSYIVSGTRDNSPPELPWPMKHLACFFPDVNQPFTLGSRTRLGDGGGGGGGGRDNSGGRVVLGK